MIISLLQYMTITSICWKKKVESFVIDEPKLKKNQFRIDAKTGITRKSIENFDFKPSEKNMNIYYEKVAERIRKINEDAEKLSVFYELFPKQTILYGNKVQYKHMDDDGNLHMQVSEMKKNES